MELEFSYALPSIGFPFCGAISAKIGANAIAAVLGLAISFKLGQIGIFSVAFDGAVHGLVANKGTIEENGAFPPLCDNASHKLNAINGEVRMELLANRTSLLSRKSDI